MLTLNVPRTEDSVLQHTAETRPKATAEWLDRLPLASPLDTAQQLVMALYALNRRPLGVDERYTLLALYHPVVARAAASLEMLLADAGVPPHAQQRQTGVLLRELLTEHSIGYKHLLLALANRRFGRALPRRASEATARLFAALRDTQVACYLAHSPPPEGLWLEMHQLYQMAHTAETVDQAVDDALPPSLVYRQALLLALADPPHMSRAEHAHTRLYLDKFAALAGLSPATAAPPQSGFAVPTDGDRGPIPLASLKEGSLLWLDTTALCQHLQETALRLRTGDSPRHIGLPQGMESELSGTLCNHLLKRWGGSAQRAFKRYPAAGSTVQVVAGVSAIHRLLERVPQAAERDASAGDSPPIHDVAPIFATLAAVNASRWTVNNDSAGGLALSGAPDAPLNLKVGDALALRTDESEAVDASAVMQLWPAPGGCAVAWSLAVIRWIRMRDAGQVELGVERLSPQMQPVWVRPLRGHRKASPEPALFVPRPASAETARPPAAAAPRLPDRRGRRGLAHAAAIHAGLWPPP